MVCVEIQNVSLFNELLEWSLLLFSAPNHLSERLKITGTRPRSVKNYKEISSIGLSVLLGFEGISCVKKSRFEGSKLIQSNPNLQVFCEDGWSSCMASGRPEDNLKNDICVRKAHAFSESKIKRVANMSHGLWVIPEGLDWTNHRIWGQKT